MENKIKHLEMIESIVERMAKNSFQLKEWTVSIVVLAGTLGSFESDKRFLLISFLAIILFWYLDSFYLKQERRYRALYDAVTRKQEKDIDFNLDTRKIEISAEDRKNNSLILCAFSPSEMFYPGLAFALVLLVLIIKGV